MALRIDKQVLGLDVPVAVAERVDVGEGAETLVGVQFDEEYGHGLLHFIVVLENAIDCLRDVVHDDVQVDLILFVSLGVKGMLECDHIRVLQFFHDLQLSILVPLVLVDLLNRNDFTSLSPRSLP